MNIFFSKQVFKQAVVLFFACSTISVAQTIDDDIFIKAMQDELNRNLTGLSMPGQAKPFFIMYGLQDQRIYTISATLGSITQSSFDFNRFRSTSRLLVGDYDFNDESLEDNHTSSSNETDISSPVDEDYWGIRRSFWATTDRVYRGATRQIQQHKETLKSTKKELKDLPHRWFGKSPAVEYYASAPAYSFQKEKWENNLRTLSGLFSDHSFVQNSAVVLRYVEGNKYLASSEGTRIKQPFSLATLMVLVQGKNDARELLSDQSIYLASSPDKLPSIEELRSKTLSLIQNLESTTNPPLAEEYTGPVLITGKAVADILSSALLRSNENIMASDNIPKLSGFQYDPSTTSLESKLGKSVIHESLTVKAKAKQKSFNDVELLGSFNVDEEGIVPSDVTVIENGQLKELLNNRTLTSSTQKVNGYNNGPGVLEITSSLKFSEKDLREKLIAAAKKEGLDFALLIKEGGSSRMGSFKVYKINVSDGKEELLRSVTIREVNLKTLKRFLGASANSAAFNLAQGNSFGAARADITSFIVPDTILLEELEVQPIKLPTFKEEEFVSRPSKK